MAELIPFKLLEKALTDCPRDYEIIDVSKTYEKNVNGKIHVGFILYIILDGENPCSILRDESYCIFTIGKDYYDDYILQNVEYIIIDDPQIPKNVRDKWVASMKDIYDDLGLDDLEDYINGGLDEVCPSLKEIIDGRLEKLRK